MKFVWNKRAPLVAAASVAVTIAVTRDELANVDIRQFAELKAERARLAFALMADADAIEKALLALRDMSDAEESR